MMAELDPLQQCPVNLAHTFSHSLVDNIKEKILRMGCNPPTGSPNVLQQSELIAVKELALGVEKDFQLQAQMISQAIAPKKEEDKSHQSS